MTARTMAQLLDRPVAYRIPGTDLIVHGTVTDVRIRFGDTDVEFTPDAGEGTKWLSQQSVTYRD